MNPLRTRVTLLILPQITMESFLLKLPDVKDLASVQVEGV